MRPLLVRRDDEGAIEDRGTDYQKDRMGALRSLEASWHSHCLAGHSAGPRSAAASESRRWEVNPKELVNELPYGQVVTLGLTNRIVPKANASAGNDHILIDGSEYMRPSPNR